MVSDRSRYILNKIPRVHNAMKNIKGKTTVIKMANTEFVLLRNPELLSTGDEADEALDDVAEFKRTFPLIKSAACSATPYPAEANYERR
jgi:hypothetical protein